MARDMIRGDLIIVSNRLPVTIADKGGKIVVGRSIGGLATALAGVIKRTRAKWVGWTGLERVLSAATLRRAGLPDDLIPVQAGFRVWKGFYENFANRLLWPSMHNIRPCYDATERDWKSYQAINRRFADAVLRTANPGDVIWVHDYHLLLLPQFLREAEQDNRVGLFLHIPFPSPEYWFSMPHAREILTSICQADVVGMQSERDVANFLECAHIAGLTGLPQVKAFPIGIDYDEYSTASTRAGVRRVVRRIRKNLGERRIIFSLSRLDYTKGIVTQLLAAEKFLASLPDRENFVYKLIVAPSRERVDEYRNLRRTISRVVRGINQRLGTPGWRPVNYSYRNIGFDEVTAWYSEAEALLLLPENDGMNLVAKEYVATRGDDRGMVVLSDTAGSSFQLADALLVPPHDLAAAAQALHTTLTMSESERARRWQRMRTNIHSQDVIWWADNFLAALTARKKS